jgi:hypothetical protein
MLAYRLESSLLNIIEEDQAKICDWKMALRPKDIKGYPYWQCGLRNDMTLSEPLLSLLHTPSMLSPEVLPTFLPYFPYWIGSKIGNGRHYPLSL